MLAIDFNCPIMPEWQAWPLALCIMMIVVSGCLFIMAWPEIKDRLLMPTMFRVWGYDTGTLLGIFEAPTEDDAIRCYLATTGLYHDAVTMEALGCASWADVMALYRVELVTRYPETEPRKAEPEPAPEPYIERKAA